MPRFFCENINTLKCLTGEDARHIALSLRMKTGDIITVCDTLGTDYECKISSIAKDKIECEILSFCNTESEPSVKVTLFQALTKGDKFETVIQKSVELGVNNIVPVISERCISRPDDKSLSKKYDRWNKISEAAAKQSGRGILPEVCPLIDYKEMLSKFKDYDKVLFLYEQYGESITEAISETDKNIAVVVGPEGGFSENEADAANRENASLINLGKRILRTETAPLAALTAVMLITGNLS